MKTKKNVKPKIVKTNEQMASGCRWLLHGGKFHLFHWSHNSSKSPCGIELTSAEMEVLPRPVVNVNVSFCDACVAGSDALDFIETWRETYDGSLLGPSQQSRIPMLGHCDCGAPLIVYFMGSKLELPSVARDIELIRVGASLDSIYAKSMPHDVCRCRDRVSELERLAEPIVARVNEDTGWGSSSTSIPSRGIHDYERKVLFNGKLSEEEVSLMLELYAKKGCPGYTGLSPVVGYDEETNRTMIRMRTTLDSSD